MLIDYPRMPVKQVIIRRKERTRVGKAQADALDSLARFGRKEKPPEGLITATGVLRKHVYNDMIPFGWVAFKRYPDGAVEYTLTKEGAEVQKNKIVMEERVTKAPGLMERQRAKSARRAHGRDVAANGRIRKQA